MRKSKSKLALPNRYTLNARYETMLEKYLAMKQMFDPITEDNKQLIQTIWQLARELEAIQPTQITPELLQPPAEDKL